MGTGEHGMSENKSIYREKSIESVNSPDKLNDYIRVSTPSVWLVMAAIVILLFGILVWSIFGTVNMKSADGTQKDVHPISFVVN